MGRLWTAGFVVLTPLLAGLVPHASAGDPPAPRTGAESSGYTATTQYGEAMAFLRELDDRSPALTLTSMGTTVEGREIPLAIVADPMVASAAEARASGRMVAFLFGAIHAGEVDGKEALLELAREWSLDPQSEASRAILDRFVVLVAPVYNADGNERIGVDTRPGQNGPAQGQGVRPNAMGLDLNRDYVKLEAPETRALVRLLNEWDPDFTIDTHTTNGSFHRYALTFEAPTNPSGHPAPIELCRDVILPEASERLEARTGVRTCFYGDFDDERSKKEWRTYSAQPRFGGPYMGLRGQMSILAESYSYAPYKERIEASREFVRECLLVAADRAVEVREASRRAKKPPIGQERGPFGLRHALARPGRPIRVAGWVEAENAAGEWRPTDEPAEHEVEHLGRFVPALSVPRASAFYIAPGNDRAIENLRLHGVAVEPVAAPTILDVDVQRIGRVVVSERAFQGHNLLLIDTVTARERRTVGPGWTRVPADTRLGNLVIYLLEPQAEDGLFAWGFFGTEWKEGDETPVLRVPAEP